MKICTACDTEKPLSEFSPGQGRCKPCRRPGKKYLAIREWMREYKTKTPCADCGKHRPPAQMHFHHRPGEIKLANVSYFVQRGKRGQAMREMAKCDLLCSRCHTMRHA